MKYQITCDNCGSKFIVDAQEGSTIECQCPNCKGVMEITLPLVSAGQEYQQQPVRPIGGGNAGGSGGNKKMWIWILIVLLLLAAIGAGAYYGLSSGGSEPSADSTVVVDTIPYSAPEPEQPEPQVVDTVQAVPQVEEEPQEPEVLPEESSPTDSTAVEPSEEDRY